MNLFISELVIEEASRGDKEGLVKTAQCGR